MHTETAWRGRCPPGGKAPHVTSQHHRNTLSTGSFFKWTELCSKGLHFLSASGFQRDAEYLWVEWGLFSICFWDNCTPLASKRKPPLGWLADFLFLKKDFIYLFLEKGAGNEKEETLIGCLSQAPNQGPGLKPRLWADWDDSQTAEPHQSGRLAGLLKRHAYPYPLLKLINSTNPETHQ